MSAKYPTKLRKHQSRSRKGCLTCRQRKKKARAETCDEVKPTCLGCRRNKLVCAWPVVAVDDADAESGARPVPDSSSSSSSRSRSSTSSTPSDASPPRDSTPASAWSPDRCAFVTVAAPASAPSSAVGLTPLSASLLRFYLVETGPLLATTAYAAHNPFVAAVVPLAHTDDLVMHCVLALGGAHLSSCVRRDHDSGTSSAGSTAVSTAVSTSSPQPDAALQAATARHYACVLRSLRGAALGALRPDDAPQVLRLLLVLLLLARYEGLSWNALGGGVRAHLRASRQLLVLLREDGAALAAGAAARPRRLSSDERGLLGALLEVYAYLVTVNRVCPGDDGDPDDNDTDHDEDFVADPGRLADQPCFGLLMAGLHDLFALVGPVTRLAARIQRAGRVSAAAAARVAALRARVCAWRLPPSPPGAATPFPGTPAGSQDRVWQRAVGEVYRHALLIYLVCVGMEESSSSSSSSSVFVGHDDDDGDDTSRPGDPLYNRTSVAPPAVRPHLSAIGQAILCTCLPVSRFGPLLLWPLLVAGSAFVSPSSRRVLSRGLRGTAIWEQLESNPDVGTGTRRASTPPITVSTPSAWPQFATAASAVPCNLTTWGMVRAADVLELLWQRHDAVVRAALDQTPVPLPASGTATVGWRAYYGPHGLARLLQETNVRPCIW